MKLKKYFSYYLRNKIIKIQERGKHYTCHQSRRDLDLKKTLSHNNSLLCRD